MSKSKINTLPYNYGKIELSQIDLSVFVDSSAKISVTKDKDIIRSMSCSYYKPICKFIEKQEYGKRKI